MVGWVPLGSTGLDGVVPSSIYRGNPSIVRLSGGGRGRVGEEKKQQVKKPVPFFQRPEQPKASEVVFLEPVSMSVGDLAAKCTEMQRLYFPQGINMQLPKRMIGKQKGDLHGGTLRCMIEYEGV